LPNEDPVLTAMKSNIQQPGLYMFPGMDLSRTPTEAENQAYSAKVQAGPSGILIYHPQNGPQMSLKTLLNELLTNILSALIAAIVLSMTVGALGARALLVGLMGLFAWLAISASHWIWYGFPTAFIIAEGLDQVIGWLLAGFLMAKLVKPAGR
jgi:hypothetical protein